MRQTLTAFVALITIMVLSLLGYTSYFSDSETPVHKVVPRLSSPFLKATLKQDEQSLNSQNDANDKEEVRSNTVTVDGQTSNIARAPGGSPANRSVDRNKLMLHVMGTMATYPHEALNNELLASATAMSTPATDLHSEAVAASIIDGRISKFKSGAPLGSLSSESHGYTLLYSVYEESTSGAKNIWQVQRLAKQLGTRVVEPFATDSVFRMNGLAPNFNQSLRFGDYFDLEKWNKVVVQHGGSPLVKWEEFLLNAPREAVVLYTMKSTNLSEPLIIAYDDDLITKCNVGKPILATDLVWLETSAIPASDLNWLKTRLNITKTMCYYCDINKKHPMSIDKFVSYVFGDKKPNQLTLILVEWLGMRQSRVDVGPKSLLSSPSLVFPMSNRIIQAYQSYKSRYIGNHKYVGIIFRTHHVLYYSPPSIEKEKYLLQCSKNLSHVLDKVREKWKIFLAYDMGTFGSGIYVTGQTKRLAPLRDQIFFDVFKGSLQVEQREEMLTQAAGGVTDRGFIALLEKTIATNADCIILLGKHSNFIRSSAALYKSLHKTKRCIVPVCSELVYGADRHLVSTSTIPDDFI